MSLADDAASNISENYDAVILSFLCLVSAEGCAVLDSCREGCRASKAGKRPRLQIAAAAAEIPRLVPFLTLENACQKTTFRKRAKSSIHECVLSDFDVKRSVLQTLKIASLLAGKITLRSPSFL